jgi:hypothetical protein
MSSAKQPLKQSLAISDPVYKDFIEENQRLLDEVAYLKHEIKVLQWDLRQYQNMAARINALIKSRESFGLSANGETC